MRSSARILLPVLAALALAACGGPEDYAEGDFGATEDALLFAPAPAQVMPPRPYEDAPVPGGIVVGSDAPAASTTGLPQDSTPDPIPIEAIPVGADASGTTITQAGDLGCATVTDPAARLRCGKGQ